MNLTEKVGHPSVGGEPNCNASGLTYNGDPIPHEPVPQCTISTRYYYADDTTNMHRPSPRKGWSLEQCQNFCKNFTKGPCTKWQWWQVEGGCRWFTGNVNLTEKEGHPSVGGEPDCYASDLTYNGIPVPQVPDKMTYISLSSGWCKDGSLFDIHDDYTAEECFDRCSQNVSCRSFLVRKDGKRCAGFSSDCSSRNNNNNVVPYTMVAEKCKIRAGKFCYSSSQYCPRYYENIIESKSACEEALVALFGSDPYLKEWSHLIDVVRPGDAGCFAHGDGAGYPYFNPPDTTPSASSHFATRAVCVAQA